MLFGCVCSWINNHVLIHLQLLVTIIIWLRHAEPFAGILNSFLLSNEVIICVVYYHSFPNSGEVYLVVFGIPLESNELHMQSGWVKVVCDLLSLVYGRLGS